MQRNSPCSTDKKVQSPAANGDTPSRKRSHNFEHNQVGNLFGCDKNQIENFYSPNYLFLQNQFHEEADEIHPTVNKKSKIENGLFLSI